MAEAAVKLPKSAYERLKGYEERGCHMLVPSAINPDDIAPGFALIVEPVLLKSHPRHKEVYADNSQEYDYRANDWKPDCKTGREMVRLHKQGFDRLAQAARIDWLPVQVIRDSVVPSRMMAHVEGMIRTSTGELYRVADAKGMDLEIERERLEFQYAKSDKEKRDYLVNRDLLQQKAYQQEKCISGARNRVIKQLLCIANAYSVDDLKKEFVVVRIVPKLDTSDPYTRKRLVDMQIAGMAGIYGMVQTAAPQGMIEMAGEVPADVCGKNGDDPDVIDLPAGSDPPPPDEPPFAAQTGPTPESLRADFVACDCTAQCKSLRAMTTGRGEGKDIDSFLKRSKQPPLEKCSPEYRLKLYDFYTEAGKGDGK